MSLRTSRRSIAVASLLVLLLLAGCQQGAGPAAGDEAPGEPGGASGELGGAPPPVRTATFPAGTAIVIRTMTTLSTKTVQAGETFAGSLEQPLVDGTWVIAPKGADIRGKVVESDPGGRVKGRAKLSIRLTQIETADGQKIDVDSSVYTVEAESTKKKDATKVGIGSAVGAAIGAIAGGGKGAAKGAAVGAGAGGGAVVATRGDPAVIGGESVVSFKLRNDVTIAENR
jgi:hypothetical protein